MNFKRLIALVVVALNCSALSMTIGWSKPANFVDSERVLLKTVLGQEKRFGPNSPEVVSSLSELAQLYSQKGRWDEYSSMRARMLEIYVKLNPKWRPPLPGGPFPRIGMPGYQSEKAIPNSLLSRWLNHETLPKFYAAEQSTVDAYERSFLKGATDAEQNENPLAQAWNLEGLAHLYCAQAKFAQAEPLYLRALSIRDQTPGLRRTARSRTLNNLAAIYRIEDRNADAVKMEARTKEPHASAASAAH